jgi:hypothetical protein
MISKCKMPSHLLSLDGREAVEKLVWMIDSGALMGYYGDKKDLLLGGGSDGS